MIERIAKTENNEERGVHANGATAGIPPRIPFASTSLQWDVEANVNSSILSQLREGLLLMRALRSSTGLYYDKMFAIYEQPFEFGEDPSKGRTSTSASGFGLVSLCIEAELGFATFEKNRELAAETI